MLGGADVDQLIKNAMIDDKIIDLKKLAEEYKKKRGDDRTVEKITAELRAAGGFKKEPFVLTEKERTKLALYLNRHILNPFEVIATSMAENKTIDLEKLQLSLLYLGVSIEIPELQAAANIAGMRGILSDEGQKKLIELLESKGIDNPVGISIKQLLLRAGFPEPVIAEFEKADYRPPLWVMGVCPGSKDLKEKSQDSSSGKSSIWRAKKMMFSRATSVLSGGKILLMRSRLHSWKKA